MGAGDVGSHSVSAESVAATRLAVGGAAAKRRNAGWVCAVSMHADKACIAADGFGQTRRSAAVAVAGALTVSCTDVGCEDAARRHIEGLGTNARKQQQRVVGIIYYVLAWPSSSADVALSAGLLPATAAFAGPLNSKQIG